MIDKVKICVYAIALNEIKHVDLFMQCCKGADLVLVCDTGSTDGTPERLRQLGATVYDIRQKPWRFDIPRNTALNLIPSDIDVCVSIDLDERLQPGWTEAINSIIKEGDGNFHRLSYEYVWSWKREGITPDIKFYADKIHCRYGYRWKHACHETLYWEGDGEEIKLTAENLIVHHYPDSSKNRSQYLPLLALAVDEDPSNDRVRHYYGRELMYYGYFDEAIYQLKQHLSIPSSTWKEERSASMRYISECYKSLGDLQAYQEWANMSTLECPYVKESWMGLVRAAYATKDWVTCYNAFVTCTSLADQCLSYISSNTISSDIYDYAALAAFNIGMKTEAINCCNIGLALYPEDLRLNINMQYYIEKMNSPEAK